MSRAHFSLPGAIVVLFIVGGCASQERPVIVENHRGPAPEVHSPAGNAIEAIKAYGVEQKDLAVNNLEQVLSDLDGQVKDMRGRSKGIASDSRESWNETLTKLEKTRDELEVIVTRMKFSTKDNWEDVKRSATKGLEEVQEDLQKLQKIARD
jgi:hypothetical protein